MVSEGGVISVGQTSRRGPRRRHTLDQLNSKIMKRSFLLSLKSAAVLLCKVKLLY